MVGLDTVDLAELLAEEVAAVEPLVELLDPRQLELLAFGELLGVLPQRELRDSFLSSRASWVWPWRRASFQTSRRTLSSA